jgi:phosphoribosylaminoimidazole-succinocarboxamide synthase
MRMGRAAAGGAGAGAERSPPAGHAMVLAHGRRRTRRARRAGSPPERSLASSRVTALALPLIARGKVRELYDLGDALLMVASDRISTYDAVHPTPIPGKGQVLTGLSAFWFERTAGLVPNHVLSYEDGVPEEVRGRAVKVRKLRMLPVECVVRGYITGSGWKDYQATGTVSGIALPAGLRESDQLPEPIFTPSTKALEGHDEAIDLEGAVAAVGDRSLVEAARDASLALYRAASEHARERGVILADTKFEFGVDEQGALVLGDEVLTPDSSRYWPADGYAPGRGQPSFDKQYVRDWAAGSGWDKAPPAPAIPDDVVAGTRARYQEAYELITGEPLSAWLSRTGAPA